MDKKIKFIIFVIAIMLIIILGSHFPFDAQNLQNSLRKIPLYYSAPVFIALYCVVTFFIWFSKDVFRFSAALAYGAYLSTLLIFIAEAINAFILFYFARVLGRSFVEGALKEKYPALDRKINRVNFLWLFLFRATPLIPFRFLDLASGLTGVSFRKYFLAVTLGSPLRIFWAQFVLAGAGLAVFKDPVRTAEYLALNKTLLVLSFAYLILVVLVAVKLKRKD